METWSTTAPHFGDAWNKERTNDILVPSKSELFVPSNSLGAKHQTALLNNKNIGFKYFPPLTNIESYAELTDTSGVTQKILVYAPGGAGDQLLLFPVLKQIKAKFPAAIIDVVSSEWAHYAYDVCPYVNKTWVYNVDGFSLPSDFLEALGNFKNEYYTIVVTAAPVGFNSAALLWMGSSTNMKGYYKADGYAGNFLAKKMMNVAVEPPAEVPLMEGTAAFTPLADMLAANLEAPASSYDDVDIGIPAYPQSFAVHTMEDLGLQPGGFILAHGVESTSKAAMQMTGGSSEMCMDTLKGVASGASATLVVAVPREVEAEAVKAALPNAKVLVVASPAKLAAMIALSKGVVAANTAALPLASYLGKPAVGLFNDMDIAAKFEFKGVKNEHVANAGDAVRSL